MSDRKEPTISPLDVDKEETRARVRATNESPQRPTAKDQNNRRPPPVSSRPVVVKSPLGPMSLLVSLVALALAVGAGAYFLWQFENTKAELAAKGTQLKSAEERILALEQRLSLSDDESSQSITVLQANIKENASEIRKLWGVSYDRNRKAIAALEVAVEDLKSGLKTTDGQLSKKLSALSTELGNEVKVLTEIIEAQQSVVSKASQSYQQHAEKLNNLSQSISKLETDLRKRVGANEEAIKAIDAFRVQVNRQLIQLKGGA